MELFLLLSSHVILFLKSLLWFDKNTDDSFLYLVLVNLVQYFLFLVMVLFGLVSLFCLFDILRSVFLTPFWIHNF